MKTMIQIKEMRIKSKRGIDNGTIVQIMKIKIICKKIIKIAYRAEA